ncbi:DUF6706 family protein [Pedobacter sp. Leaf170]|uniref:DUF6706 family protein n=1 Tax=Pedobacter sp. Leaf170 TaxID=2876558 RepID=UPI001E492B66|nr:DUF6706 family protein [Pedobacter sp. Leaf170]
MTIKAALKSTVDYPLPDNRIEKALIDAGLNGDTIYTQQNEKDVDVCMIGLLLTVCTSGSISEGGYSISNSDKDNLLRIRSLLLSKWKMVDTMGSSINDATYLH